MTKEQFAAMICGMTTEQQNSFFQTLRKTVSEKDCIELEKFVSLYSIMRCEAKRNAVAKVVKDMLIKELSAK